MSERAWEEILDESKDSSQECISERIEKPTDGVPVPHVGKVISKVIIDIPRFLSVSRKVNTFLLVNPFVVSVQIHSLLNK